MPQMEQPMCKGRFNGFSTWLSKCSPGQIHVWCYSHILNLIIIEATKSPLQAASLFMLLNDVAIFFKESYKRMNIWKKTIGEKDLRKLVTIGNTSWWSKEKALHHIFVDQGHLFVEMILALDTMQTLDFKNFERIIFRISNYINGIYLCAYF